MTNTATTKAIPPKSCESRAFTKRIGQTTYRVGVHFSDKNRETIDEKLSVLSEMNRQWKRQR